MPTRSSAWPGCWGSRICSREGRRSFPAGSGSAWPSAGRSSGSRGLSVDEPLSNLDARLRIEMRAELKRLHRQLGITTVYVTHDQAEAMGLSDRLAVLDKGEVQQCDTPVEVYRNPANIFVAGFIGIPPMNFLECTVRKKEPAEVDCNGLVFSPELEKSPSSQTAIIGVRPEDLIIETTKMGGSIEVVVQVVEPAGSFNWVELLWKKAKLRGMSRPEDKLNPGNTVYLTFPIKKLSLFDGSSGKRL